MNSPKIWMVRSGSGAAFVDDFLEQGVVAIGWRGAGPFAKGTTKKTIEAKVAESEASASPGSIGMWASQIKRFYDEIQVGDAVMTYEPGQRVYFLGEVLSDVKDRDHPLSRSRQVKWTTKVARDNLQTATRNSLGSILTLFLVKDEAAQDTWHHTVPIDAPVPDTVDIAPMKTDAVDDERVLLEEVTTKAEEFIEDRIAKLDWEQMQELMAEILIAMGYRARVSRKGPDRGQDIFASPDGLGLQEPRIFVEVKHRRGTPMGANDVRSFLGGRQPGDRCLYVSTGGFTKEARYEAERSSIPLTLITLQELRELLIEHYDNMRPTGTALVPLERLYWPA